MEKIKGQIYIHTNKITGKHYVGQTIASPIEARWSKGVNSYNKTTKFGRAIKKYGWGSFEHVILPEIYESHEELDKAEVNKIAELDSYKNGYNSTLGGNGSSGYVKSDESKKKISEALRCKEPWNKGRRYKLSDVSTKSEEIKLKISNSLKGIKKSEEAKANISKAHKGKTLSDETKAKLREAATGKKHSDETKTKLREAGRRRVVTEETRFKLSEAAKRRIRRQTSFR